MHYRLKCSSSPEMNQIICKHNVLRKNTYRLDWIVSVAVCHQIRKTICIFFVSFWRHHLIDSFKWSVRMLVANSNVGYLDGLVLPWEMEYLNIWPLISQMGYIATIDKGTTDPGEAVCHAKLGVLPIHGKNKKFEIQWVSNLIQFLLP